MTREGASTWAKRMKIAAVETARIPKARARKGGRRGEATGCIMTPIIK